LYRGVCSPLGILRTSGIKRLRRGNLGRREFTLLREMPASDEAGEHREEAGGVRIGV
jgi:hypothetical protein